MQLFNAAFRAGLVAALTGILLAQSGDVFQSPTVGLELTKPAHWHYVSAQQNLDNLREAKMSDAQLQQAAIRFASAPLVAVARYEEPHPDLNPSFKVNFRPLGRLRGQAPLTILNAIMPTFARMFNDLAYAESPREVTVSGLRAAYTKVHYTLRTRGGQAFQTASQIWIVPRGEYLFMMAAGTKQGDTSEVSRDIASIVQSVKIDR